MNIFVHSKTLPVTQAIRGFVMDQVRKIKKLSQPVSEVRVFLEDVKTSQGLAQESQVKVKVSVPGKDILTKARGKDLYFTISAAVDDAKRALRKRKEYRITKKTELRVPLRARFSVHK